MTVENNECGAAVRLPKDLERLFDASDIIRIADAQDVPSIGEEPTCNVFGERDARIAFNCDVIVVVNPAKIVEPKVSRQRCRLRCDAFHQASVTTDRINVVVEQVETWPIVAAAEPLLRDRHANARCRTLSERASCGLDSRDPVVFRMPGSFTIELAEAANIVERDRRL